MTIQLPDNSEAQILGLHATRTLAAALRAKKQNVAPIIIKHEKDLHSFSPLDWIDLAIARAASQDCQFAKHGGQYLSPLFADTTGWSASDYKDHLIQCAGSLADNLAHPQHLSNETHRIVRDLYHAIPANLRELANLPPAQEDAPDNVTN